MDWTIELIVVPASDVDRAKAFYGDQMGFELLVDHSAGEDFRVVQMVPPGSACAIAIMKNTAMAPGALQGIHLIVPDIEAARAELTARGVEASDYFHFGAAGQTDGLAPGRGNYETFFTLSDPDGNGWLVQEVNRAKPNEQHALADA